MATVTEMGGESFFRHCQPFITALKPSMILSASRRAHVMELSGSGAGGQAHLGRRVG
jgi:hypothetical protein